MSSRTSWVISPTDRQGHPLAMKTPELRTTQCRQSLPSGVLRHDRLPSRHLRRDCLAAYLLPAAAFAHITPAGRQSSPAPPRRVPGGQPVPPDPSPEASYGCPAPPLTRAETATAGLSGQGQTLCGRQIPATGLALSGPSARFCAACVAEGTRR